MKKHTLIFILFITFATSACQFLKLDDPNKIDIPQGVTEEELQDARYKYKRDLSYKEKHIYQNKTTDATITIYNVINYQIKDEIANVGDGFEYLIFDISVDNPTNNTFNISDFSKSCYLGNSTPNFAYSNVGFALKMYHLQSDSAQIDMEYIKRFYEPTMPAKQFYRGKLFCYEVSKEDKEPLFFRYKIGEQTYEYKVRDKRY
jgi:hypothetical protein